MTQKTDSYFKAHDNHRLFYECHRAKKTRAVLVMVHGLNEHIGRYAHVVDYFKTDYTTYLFDQRGHGRSDGVRSHVESFEHYTRDLHEFLKFVAHEEVGLKIFLIAHSMGGQVALNYLGTHADAPVAGFITSSANLRVKMKINALKKFLGTKLSEYFPKLTVANDINPKWISRDKKIVAQYKQDPLVGQKISIRLATEILKNHENVMALAPKIKIPALMLHGGADNICDKQGSVDFFERLASQDKKIRIYEGMYHEILNEIGREEVLADMAGWLKKHVS